MRAETVDPLPIEAFPLRGLLVCTRCRERLYPLRRLGGPRAYRSPCGCRMWPTDATAIERVVFQAVAGRNPALLAVVPDFYAAAYQAMLVEVGIGGTIDDLTFVWRTS